MHTLPLNVPRFPLCVDRVGTRRRRPNRRRAVPKPIAHKACIDGFKAGFAETSAMVTKYIDAVSFSLTFDANDTRQVVHTPIEVLVNDWGPRGAELSLRKNPNEGRKGDDVGLKRRDNSQWRYVSSTSRLAQANTEPRLSFSGQTWTCRLRSTPSQSNYSSIRCVQQTLHCRQKFPLSSLLSLCRFCSYFSSSYYPLEVEPYNLQQWS